MYRKNNNERFHTKCCEKNRLFTVSNKSGSLARRYRAVMMRSCSLHAADRYKSSSKSDFQKADVIIRYQITVYVTRDPYSVFSQIPRVITSLSCLRQKKLNYSVTESGLKI